jgi:hypothetical protein
MSTVSDQAHPAAAQDAPSGCLSRAWRFLGSELVLGCLVASLSVMIAFSAYQSNLASSTQATAIMDGQRVLSLSNAEYLRATAQEVIQDYNLYDGYFINFDRDPEVADYYYGVFSDELIASLERPDGPFDAIYYDAVYADSDAQFDEAMDLFALADEQSAKSDQFQLAALIFAVGLSLAAWAAILKADSGLRPVYALLASLVFVVALTALMSAYLLYM